MRSRKDAIIVLIIIVVSGVLGGFGHYVKSIYNLADDCPNMNDFYTHFSSVKLIFSLTLGLIAAAIMPLLIRLLWPGLFRNENTRSVNYQKFFDILGICLIGAFFSTLILEIAVIQLQEVLLKMKE